MRQFERDLLESIRQARRGQGRVTKVAVSVATEVRVKIIEPTLDFAETLRNPSSLKRNNLCPYTE